MTTIALNPNQMDSQRSTAMGFGSLLVASFSEFCAGVRDGQEIHDRYRRYCRMSQADLAELGMTRAEIYRAALIGRPV